MLLTNPNQFGQPFTNPGAFNRNPLQPQAPVQSQSPKQVAPPEAAYPRGLNYYADYSGCGFWRMIWPEFLINMYQKMVVHGSTCMCLDPRYYQGVKAVRIQRQASENQLQFAKFLRELADKMNFKLLFEIDDIMFHEDIPDYNKFKVAFTDPKVRKCGEEIMRMCDEITVTCEYMKEYYADKTGNKNVTVLPNYVPRFWMDRFYDRDLISKNYSKNRKKPRVIYAGSGAHVDVENRVNRKDDFEHVADVIARTTKDFQWVFVGAFPLQLQPLVQSGAIEFHEWKHLMDYPRLFQSLNANAMIAPLQNNTFNKSKSDLKYVEACCFGLPLVAQDLCTYGDAPYKFETGNEMVDQLKYILKNRDRYMSISDQAWKYAQTRWLEDHTDKHVELYTVPKESGKRKHLTDNLGKI